MFPGADEYGVDVTVSDGAVDRALAVDPADVDPAPELSYCRNVFVPLTTACRYTCTSCTYYDPPGQASLLSPGEIRDIVERGADAGCTEALFTFGDDPDDRYTAIHDQLHEWGHDSIHAYLREACEIALDAGLLPHSNPGDQTREQMELVADLNASMGVMLETTAEVQAHGGPGRSHRASGSTPSRPRASSACRSRRASSSASARRGATVQSRCWPSVSSTSDTATFRR